jgi:MFS family permease
MLGILRPQMRRSLNAVLIGTFTLRFSTGLTGALLVYYLAELDSFGAAAVTAVQVGILTAAFYLAELVLSPFFGMLSDRLGSRPVMQFGPVFGAVAVVMTALTTDLFLLGTTRWLEGAAAAASIPSILGYIALATSHDEGLRGRTVAQFEAATLAGLGLGLVAAGGLWALLDRNAFYLNAVLYGISFLIYRYGVTEGRPGTAAEAHREVGEIGAGGVTAVAHGFDVARYRRVLASASVWLLAPTWIAINAFIGAWTSQSIFQLVNEPRPGFEDQLLMGGFAPAQVSIGLAVALLVFFAGLFYWGNRFKRYRRTTIMAIGAAGGIAMVAASFGLNHAETWPPLLRIGLGIVAAGGLFVLAGATPAALGMLADISEEHPDDRGAIMGLYSVFLAVGQVIGSLVGGGAAEWLGIDGLLLASAGLLLVALIPLRWLRGSEHLVGLRPGMARPAEGGG